MDAAVEPKLIDRIPKPTGVLRQNSKTFVYLGVVGVLCLATLFGDTKKKPVVKAAAAPPPITATNTDNNAASLKATVEANREAEEQQAAQRRAQQALQQQGMVSQPYAMNGYSATGQPLMAAAPGLQPVAQVHTGTSAGTISPEQQEAEQLAQKERERQYQARFESNLVYTASAAPARADSAQSAYSPQQGQPSNLQPAQSAEKEQGSAKHAEINLDSATGQPYVVYEGTTLDTVLMNRLDGDSIGPVKVLVSEPLYSHDGQHKLIPDGTEVLGEARKIGNSGFGQQRRIAVVFHRMIMPDGYSVDLDQFHGLDQIGEEALKDKVNNHYLQIFGTSIALGVISGAAQITEGGTGYSSSGSQAFTNGAAAGVSQQAATVLDRFIQIPPTITIREGHRVKIWISQDMLLPAYENHTIPQSF